MPQDDWVRMDALLWWTKGAAIPPLLTTSPDATPYSQAGVLGQPGTSILFGNQQVNGGFRPGGRISFGTWLDCADDVGVEMSYLALGQSVQRYDAASTGSPILARPFFKRPRQAQASSPGGFVPLIAYPNVRTCSKGVFRPRQRTTFRSPKCSCGGRSPVPATTGLNCWPATGFSN